MNQSREKNSGSVPHTFHGSCSPAVL